MKKVILAILTVVILAGIAWWYANSIPGTTTNSVTSQYLSASPGSGIAPLTVLFSSSYSYPRSYLGGKGLVIYFGEGYKEQFDGKTKHVYTSHGDFTAILYGCNVNVDLFCEEVELDRIIISVTDVPENFQQYTNKSCKNGNDCGGFPCISGACFVKQCKVDSDCPDLLCSKFLSPTPHGYCTSTDVK